VAVRRTNWAFILIGNAAAIIVLSSVTAGGTSSMGYHRKWRDVSRSTPA
jgi:hypothetical protein